MVTECVDVDRSLKRDRQQKAQRTATERSGEVCDDNGDVSLGA